MSIVKATRARPTEKKKAVGLMAIGASGGWEIAIDQSTAGPDRWFAQVEGPAVCVSLEIPSLQILDRVSHFLSRGDAYGNGAHTASGGTLSLGTDKSGSVKLVHDDEFSDRYFLVVELKNGPVVRFTVAGEDRKHLLEALRQVMDDLRDDS